MNELFSDTLMLDDGELMDVQTFAASAMTTSQCLTELAVRFFTNLLVCWVIVRFLYYRKSRRRDYYFTFLVFSSAMLLLLYMMGNVEIGVGLTLGLFAIFGVIRYRTETVPIREMTYLFAIIAISAVNGLSPVFEQIPLPGGGAHYSIAVGKIAVTAVTNLLMILLMWILEENKILKHVSAKLILYDRIELIVPERRRELLEDLRQRTGLEIDNIEIGHVDFLRDAAFIKVYYTLKQGESDTIGFLTKPSQFV